MEFTYAELLMIYDGLEKIKGTNISYKGEKVKAEDLMNKVKQFGDLLAPVLDGERHLP